ncbi:MAG: lipopolysaccharide biosynthesis protein [Candidatus Eisenbacteria bacterium]
MSVTRRRLDAGLLWRRARASAFARNVAILTSGAAIGHALTALAAPALSRLYDPAQFGLLALFTAVISILSEAASWRYGLAVVLPAADEEAANLLALASLIVVGMAAFALLAVALGGRWAAEALDSPELAAYLWWTPVALLSIGAAHNFSYWATRKKAFGRISVSQITRSAGAATAQIAGGLLGAGTGGLVGGRVTGEASAAVALGWQVLRADGRDITRAVSRRRMREVSRQYSDFPRFSLPQGLINAVSQSVPVFLLAHYFDTQVVGLYAMAHRLLQLPARFVGQAVRQVFLQQANEAHLRGFPLFPLAARATLGLAALGILPAAAILIFGPRLFGFLLGPEWVATGGYARWMILWLFFAFINPPATALTQILRRQQLLLVFDIVLLVSRTALLVIGGLYYSAMTSVALFSVTGAVLNAGLIAGMLLYSRRARTGLARG